jgi:(p)ppGpp synthase/HD superfamily hydrolase
MDAGSILTTQPAIAPPAGQNSPGLACAPGKQSGQANPAAQPAVALLESWGAGDDLLAAARLAPLVLGGSLAAHEIARACGQEVADLCQRLACHVELPVDGARRPDHRPPSLAKLFLAGYCDPRLAIMAAAWLWSRCGPASESDLAAAGACTAETQRVLILLLEMLGMWGPRKELEIWLRQQAKGPERGVDTRHRPETVLNAHQALFCEIESALAAALPAATLRRREVSLALPDLHAGSLDALGIDVLVDDEAACYHALYEIRRLWRPAERMVQDYIAAGKVNGYRCLRTAVTIPWGGSTAPVKFHIQTEEMEEINNWGVAAIYMRQRLQPDLPQAWWSNRPHWYQRLMAAPAGALPALVCVFSPQGQVFEFERGCTVVDYAYQVHSDLADQCAQFLVNGEKRSPTTVLRHLDVVELVHETGAPGPTRVWLEAARTSRARVAIDRFLKRQGGKSFAGRSTVDRKLAALEQHYGFTLPPHRIEQTLQQASRHQSPPTLEQLLSAIADGQVAPDGLLHPLFADEVLRQVELPEGLHLYPRQIKLCQSCRPRIGEDICGRLRLRRDQVAGITVHRAGCTTLDASDSSVALRWRWHSVPKAFADLELVAADEPGLLGKALEPVYSRSPAVMLHQATATAHRGTAHIRFTIQADDEAVIDQVIDELQRLPTGAPEAVRRLKPSFYVLERLNQSSARAISNPYGRHPVREREMFFGRHNEIERILDHVQGANGVVFLRGRKRVGKTSLLWHLRDFRLDPNLFVPCHIDFQLFGGLADGSSLWFDIADAAFRDLQKNGRVGEVERPLPDLFAESPAERLLDFFMQLRTHFVPRRPVFLLDEFSVVIDAYQQGRLPADFFQQWRGILQATSAGIAYVMVVQQHTWDALGPPTATQAGSPVGQILELGSSLQLKALSTADIRELIRRPTRNFLTYPPDALDQVVQLTGSSPFLVQAFCYDLVQHMASQAHHQVTQGDVDTVASQFMGVDETLFIHVLDGAGPSTFAICFSMARLGGAQNGPVALPALHSDLPGMDAGTLRTLLRVLCEQAVVCEPSPGQWRFASALFHRWLQANVQLEQLHRSQAL